MNVCVWKHAHTYVPEFVHACVRACVRACDVKARGEKIRKIDCRRRNSEKEERNREDRENWRRNRKKEERRKKRKGRGGGEEGGGSGGGERIEEVAKRTASNGRYRANPTPRLTGLTLPHLCEPRT